MNPFKVSRKLILHFAQQLNVNLVLTFEEAKAYNNMCLLRFFLKYNI